jgi:hypothetical protein
MAKTVKTLNLLNQDYEFDAAKLGGQLPQSFVSTSGATMQGDLVFDGTNKIESMGAMAIESSDSIDIDAGTHIELSAAGTNLKIQNGGVYINNQRVVPGGGSSSGGLSYVGTGVSYDGNLFDFEDLDFNTNSLNGHHVLID